MCMQANSTLTDLNLSLNRFGKGSYEGGSVQDMGTYFYRALSENETLIKLDLSRSEVSSEDLVTVTTGVKRNQV